MLPFPQRIVDRRESSKISQTLGTFHANLKAGYPRRPGAQMDDYMQETEVKRINIFAGGVKELLQQRKARLRPEPAEKAAEESGTQPKRVQLDESAAVDEPDDEEFIAVPKTLTTSGGKLLESYGDGVTEETLGTVEGMMQAYARASPPGRPPWLRKYFEAHKRRKPQRPKAANVRDARSDIPRELRERSRLPFFSQLHEEILDFCEYIAPTEEEVS